MAMSDNRSNFKRTNLFVLRVWCDDENENAQGDKGERSGRMWHGKVQRTVSGETHSFEAKDHLIEVLEAMLYKDRKDRPEHSSTRPRGTTSSNAGVPVIGSNEIEANEEDHHVQ